MAEVLELSTTEIVALARGLGAPLPAFARPASGEAWNDATAQEIADIGVQTLAARDLVRPSQGALAVPAQLAWLYGASVRPSMVGAAKLALTSNATKPPVVLFA